MIACTATPTLEEPDTREFALADPRSLLARFREGAVLDEVQRAPQILSYLQGLVFRDSNGNEVDLVLEFSGKTLAVEIKSGATLAGDWFGGLHRFARAAGSVSLAIVYGGDRSFEREGVAVHGWRDLPKLLATAT